MREAISLMREAITPSREPRSCHLMREAIRGSSNQIQSDPIRRNQTHSDPLRRNQTQSDALRPNQTQSDAFIPNWTQSDAIRPNPI